MRSAARTVRNYLAELTPERRAAIEAVRAVILKNLDRDYEEGMQYGMICYYVPHSIFPPGYHCDPRIPLPFAGLASQKQYMAVYIMSELEDAPGGGWFRKAWAKTGKKLDMGKCCIRFKKVEDLALDVIGEAIRRIPVKDYVAYYKKTRELASRDGPRRAASRRPAARTPSRPRSARRGSSVK